MSAEISTSLLFSLLSSPVVGGDEGRGSSPSDFVMCVCMLLVALLCLLAFWGGGVQRDCMAGLLDLPSLGDHVAESERLVSDVPRREGRCCVVLESVSERVSY